MVASANFHDPFLALDPKKILQVMNGCRSFLLKLLIFLPVIPIHPINNTAGWHGYDEVLRDVGDVTS